MKIILLQDVKGVGQKFEEKNVSEGYASNFLIPKKLALPVSGQSVAMINQLKAQSDAKRKEEDKRIEEKEEKRREKRAALEQFRQSQQSQK